jgi:hypothetical protein
MSYPASLNSTGAIVFGSLLALGGLVLIILAVTAGDDSPLFALGGLVFVGGVVRLTTALSTDARRRRSYRADPTDPRWHGGAGIVQLAGRTCVECQKRIIIGSDGVSCDDCAAPMHRECNRPHHEHAHVRHLETVET